MSKGKFLAIAIAGATVALIAIGTVWPNASAVALAGGATLLRPNSTPEAAVANLAQEIGRHDWKKAYSSLNNKAEFTESEFQQEGAQIEQVIARPANHNQQQIALAARDASSAAAKAPKPGRSNWVRRDIADRKGRP